MKDYIIPAILDSQKNKPVKQIKEKPGVKCYVHVKHAWITFLFAYKIFTFYFFHSTCNIIVCNNSPLTEQSTYEDNLICCIKL